MVPDSDFLSLPPFAFYSSPSPDRFSRYLPLAEVFSNSKTHAQTFRPSPRSSPPLFRTSLDSIASDSCLASLKDATLQSSTGISPERTSWIFPYESWLRHLRCSWGQLRRRQLPKCPDIRLRPLHYSPMETLYWFSHMKGVTRLSGTPYASACEPQARSAS